MKIGQTDIQVFLFSTSKYGEGMNDLEGVDNSVNSLRPVLEEYGNVVLCHNRTQAEVTANFTDFINGLHSESVLLFYYCGHGNLTDDNQSLRLGTSDTSKKTCENTGLECNYVIRKIKEYGIKKYILILDCCHSGFATQDTMGKRSPEELANNIAKKLDAKGSVIVSSTEYPYETAKQREINGKYYAIFTYFFAQVIQNGIPGKPGMLTMQDVFDETKKLMNNSEEATGAPLPGIAAKSEFDSFPLFKNHATLSNLENKEQERSIFLSDDEKETIIQKPYTDSELVFALTGAIGTDLKEISQRMNIFFGGFWLYEYKRD